jgi:plasmid stabilization system protein ParE
MQLKLSARAERDIQDLVRFGFSQYGFRFTEEYARQLRQRMGQLRETPFIGAPRGDVRPGIRLLVFKAHNIPYRVTGETVEIILVLHRNANWANPRLARLPSRHIAPIFPSLPGACGSSFPRGLIDP